MTCPSTQACGWPGQDKILSCHNPFDTLLILLGTQKYRWLVRVSGCSVPLSLLTSPQASPEPSNTEDSESGFFHDTKYVVSPPTPSSSQHQVGSPQSIDFWYHVCGVSANATGWGIETALTSVPAVCSQVIMFLNKWLKPEISTLPPCSKTQSNQWTNSGKLLFTVLRVTYRKKLRNSEMEEIFRSWV